MQIIGAVLAEQEKMAAKDAAVLGANRVILDNERCTSSSHSFGGGFHLFFSFSFAIFACQDESSRNLAKWQTVRTRPLVC